MNFQTSGYTDYPAPYGHWPSVKGEPDNEFAGIYQDLPMTSVPREGISQQLIDWIMLRHDKMPGEEDGYYESLPQLPNDLPTLRNYYSQMSIVDKGVGKVLKHLDDNDLADNTVFIYTADHGMSLGQHGFWGHGEDTWPSNTHREAHNIPLIVRSPNCKSPGSVVSSMAGTTDVFTTILDYSGQELPSIDDAPGRSLRPMLEGETVEWEQNVYMEQEETRSVRTPEWLFMKRVPSSGYAFSDELYDLKNDPGERTNLANDKAYQGIVDELSVKLDAFFERYADPKWNLWKGGRVKSNSTRPFLWQEMWGDDWTPSH